VADAHMPRSLSLTIPVQHQAAACWRMAGHSLLPEARAHTYGQSLHLYSGCRPLSCRS
jgi:hypothetical protein